MYKRPVLIHLNIIRFPAGDVDAAMATSDHMTIADFYHFHSHFLCICFAHERHEISGLSVVWQVTTSAIKSKWTHPKLSPASSLDKDHRSPRSPPFELVSMMLKTRHEDHPYKLPLLLSTSMFRVPQPARQTYENFKPFENDPIA